MSGGRSGSTVPASCSLLPLRISLSKTILALQTTMASAIAPARAFRPVSARPGRRGVRVQAGSALTLPDNITKVCRAMRALQAVNCTAGSGGSGGRGNDDWAFRTSPAHLSWLVLASPAAAAGHAQGRPGSGARGRG